MADITIRKILTILQSEYPNSFVNMDARTMQLKIQLWETEFRNDDLNLVYAAVGLYMQTPERFAPSIGQVRENMRTLLNVDTPQLTDQDAWALVSKACSNGIHHSVEEFKKLPPEVQKAVGGPEQLKAWAMMDSETVESVVSSNFKRTFRTTQEREKQLSMVPPEVRQMIAGISQSMELSGGDQKQLEGRKEKLLPMPLEPMRRMATTETVLLKADNPANAGIAQTKYTPPPPDEWERRREEALRMLLND